MPVLSHISMSDILPTQRRILPKTAQPSASRQAPTVDLGYTAEPWLVKALQRFNEGDGTLETASQCSRLLKDILGRPEAKWLLASVAFPVMLPQASPHESLYRSDGLALIHITAYPLYVDMSARSEMAFKLLPSTQAELVRLHREMCIAFGGDVPLEGLESADASFQDLNGGFACAIAAAIFHASVSVLANMEEDGSGELLEGRPLTVRRAIVEMLFRFLPASRSGLYDPSLIFSVYLEPASSPGESLAHTSVVEAAAIDTNGGENACSRASGSR